MLLSLHLAGKLFITTRTLSVDNKLKALQYWLMTTINQNTAPAMKDLILCAYALIAIRGLGKVASMRWCVRARMAMLAVFLKK